MGKRGPPTLPRSLRPPFLPGADRGHEWARSRGCLPVVAVGSRTTTSTRSGPRACTRAQLPPRERLRPEATLPDARKTSVLPGRALLIPWSASLIPPVDRQALHSNAWSKPGICRADARPGSDVRQAHPCNLDNDPTAPRRNSSRMCIQTSKSGRRRCRAEDRVRNARNRASYQAWH